MEFQILILEVLGLVIFLFWISVAFLGAPFESTSRKTLKKMIEFSKIKKGDIVADLGSGNGKVVIEFAKLGIEAHGFEINHFLVWFSRRKIKKLNLEKKAFIHRKNFWKQNLSKFDVISIFQVGYIMGKLERKLKRELKHGSRVVSNTWKFPNWKYNKKDKWVFLYEV
jgi:cyclopropane fatty-acyl-phospholipid synthase-like methyltransferase|tara:strand:+ start:752 stop:1255 length:504 start_codon:yes stop_codon:yes gene_type:complete